HDLYELHGAVRASRALHTSTAVGVFFFFQAEDGIRDGHVTGVQTCALPISCASAALLCLNKGVQRKRKLWSQAGQQILRELPLRSEERRVEKECRSRWWP